VLSRGIDGVKVKTTYLEMLARPERVVPPPKEGLAVVRAQRPSVAYYRFLYDAVGRDYDWTSRKRLADAELAALLNDPRLEVHVLMADGVPAGFAELDRRIEGEIELVQFGLMPGYLGQGLGKYFLQWTIDKAWSYGPRRLWLHTCTKDHPAALPNYLKAVFTIYQEGFREDDQ
jgi:GNAT superfamily N-acetyltransferase